jgi:carboxypeptidase C (cathepsin A)
MFFWFFESKNDAATDPLALWLQGGPLSPSIDQAVWENGQSPQFYFLDMTADN